MDGIWEDDGGTYLFFRRDDESRKRYTTTTEWKKWNRKYWVDFVNRLLRDGLTETTEGVRNKEKIRWEALLDEGVVGWKWTEISIL
jgi:hypothetical protein